MRADQVAGDFYFGLAGFIHFFVGWTLLSISQKRIGAARTSAIMGVTPFFASARRNAAWAILDDLGLEIPFKTA